MRRRPTRREFIQTTAVGGAALATGLGCESGGTIPVGDDDDSAPGPGGEVDGRVVVARADSAEAAVIRAVELYGGLSFVEPGDRVMVKPNYCGPFVPPDTTSGPVLAEVIRQCQAAGAGEVVVAERAWWGFATEGVFDNPIYEDGACLLDFVEETGATFLPLDDQPTVQTWPDGAADYDAPLRIFDLSGFDHLVNVPGLKTHVLAAYTIAMKNLLGLVHPDTRQDQVHRQPDADQDPDRIPRMMAQLNLAFDPAVHIVDGLLARTTGGPTPPGDEFPTDLVLVGRDRIAVDAVGLAILRTVGTEPHIEDRPVWDQVMVAEAVRLGLGVSGPDDVELISEGIDEIEEIEENLRQV